MILAVGGAAFLWARISGPGGSSGSAKKANSKNGAGGIVPVVAAKARTGDIGVYFTGLGTVTPLNTATIKSRVDGQLLKVQYKEGEVVHQGDLLVQIDPRPYQAALEQAQGQLAKDQAALVNARIDAVRYRTLFNEKVLSEQQATTQEALVGQDEGAVKADQGQVDTAKVNLSYCQILAPITGRIGLRLVDTGNIIHAADPNGLLVITQMQPISVIFTIGEDQLPPIVKKISAGQKLTVEADNRDMTAKIAEGSLTTLDNEIDPSTGTLKLRATFDNEDNALFPNQFVNIRLLIQEKKGVTLAPTAAIQRNSQNTYVYVVGADSTVTLRNITLGASEGDDSEITSGLVPGDVVVLTGVDKLQEGSKVNAQMAPVNPPPTPGAPNGAAPPNSPSSDSTKSVPRTRKSK